MIKFYKDYHLDLDPNYRDKKQSQEVLVDFSDEKQLYNIIKKRALYKFWQPENKERKRLIRALEELDKEK